RGEALTVRVRLVRGTVQLELLHRSGARGHNRSADSTLFSRFLSANRLADDGATREVFRGFLASFRVLSPELFRRSVAQLRVRPQRTRGTARAVVELTDREISVEHLDPKHAAALLAWFTGGSDGRSGADQRGGSDGPRNKPNPDIAALKTFLHRVTTTAEHPLQLYNALLPITTDRHWVVFPIRATAGAQSLFSVLKVCWDVRKSRPLEAVLSIDRGNGRWWFRWEIDRVTRLVGAGAEGTTTAPPDTLLAILGGTRHTETEVNSDGFSLETPRVENGSIDHYG
ncbi:MAG: hypothetical protein PF508_18080, partial [Spirochaeta sp.]|nr:hypothetical protein [Spirochaeta sp.]